MAVGADGDEGGWDELSWLECAEGRNGSNRLSGQRSVLNLRRREGFRGLKTSFSALLANAWEDQGFKMVSADSVADNVYGVGFRVQDLGFRV